MLQPMPNTIHFGKNIISILTSGMYKDPEFLFREYIQNAADQIDKDRETTIQMKASASSWIKTIVKLE